MIISYIQVHEVYNLVRNMYKHRPNLDTLWRWDMGNCILKDLLYLPKGFFFVNLD